MKKKISALLAVMFAFLMMVPAALPVSAAEGVTYELYVAKDGDDSNDGSIDSPFATLEKARDTIRELKASGGFPDSGITVYIREGDYNVEKTFELGPQDSGTYYAPIIYKAYPGEKVSFIGGKELDQSKFRPLSEGEIKNKIPESARANVVEMDLKEQGITDYGELKPYGFANNVYPAQLELFLDDTELTLARYPNEGEVPMGEIVFGGDREQYLPGEFISTYEGITKWSNPTEAFISGCLTWGYSDETVGIGALDPETRKITLASPVYHALKTGMYYSKHFYFNIIEELDYPGEYYIDRDTGMLYMYPLPDSSSKRMMASILEEPMMAIEDSSYVSISGINFECSRGMGIYLEKGDSVKILDCVFKNMGNVGIMVGKSAYGPHVYDHNIPNPQMQSRIVGNVKGIMYEDQMLNREGGKNHVISGCTIYNMGCGGVIVGAGDRETLTPSDIMIVNNVFHDVNRREKTYKPPVWIDGVGVTVAHNEFYNIPSMAIHLMGNDHRIEYNSFHDCVTVSDDMGAIYAGRNPSEFGNSINYNSFINIGQKEHISGTSGQQSIFWDDWESNATVFGNLFVNAGSAGAFKTNRPSMFNLFANNIVVDTKKAIQLNGASDNSPLTNADFDWESSSAATIKKRVLDDLDLFNNTLYQAHYPLLKDCFGKTLASNVAENNVLVNSELAPSGWTINANFVGDPGFVDAANGNYNLRDDSPVFTQLKYFEKLPVDLMGPYQEAVDKKLENSVAMFVGNPHAIAKGEKTLIDPENMDVKPVVINDRTLVPVRFISANFGGEVGWNDETQEITINVDGKEIKLALGSNIMTVDGQETQLEVPA